jgi:hypothetical protein
MDRLKILKIYLWVLGIFLFFWWPLSHWLYPDWYHNLLGFQTYDYALVKIIGTCGVMPVLGIFFAALNPERNRDILLVLIIFAVLMAATYTFLIIAKGFPTLEYINVAMSFLNAVILFLLLPHKTVRLSTRGEVS